jgi:hypothetical protein
MDARGGMQEAKGKVGVTESGTARPRHGLHPPTWDIASAAARRDAVLQRRPPPTGIPDRRIFGWWCWALAGLGAGPATVWVDRHWTAPGRDAVSAHLAVLTLGALIALVTGTYESVQRRRVLQRGPVTQARYALIKDRRSGGCMALIFLDTSDEMHSWDMWPARVRGWLPPTGRVEIHGDVTTGDDTVLTVGSRLVRFERSMLDRGVTRELLVAVGGDGAKGEGRASGPVGEFPRGTGGAAPAPGTRQAGALSARVTRSRPSLR